MAKDGRTVTFATIDPGTRSRLNDRLINRAEIEKWRATLALNERAKTNHPNAVWRKWHAGARQGGRQQGPRHRAALK